MMSGNNSYSVKQNAIFVDNFYWKFQAPNAEELIDFVNNPGEPIDNDYYEFGGNCYFDCIPLKKNRYKKLIKPSLQVLMSKLNIGKIKLSVVDAWISVYQRGYSQEIHDHDGDELISVFFANDGPGFSDFYFYDRMYALNSRFWKDILELSEWHIPKIKAGDIIFFPGKLLHGVTPHQSDVERRTLAMNFNPVTPTPP